MKQLLYLNKNLNANMNIKPKDYYHSLILKDNKIYDGDNIIHHKFLDDIIQLSASNNHSLALTAEGEVYVFGNNDHGQLGLGHNFDCNIPQLINDVSDIISISVSDKHSMILTAKGDVYISGNGDSNIFKYIYMKDIIQISAGFSHSLALSSCGKIYIIELNDTKLLIENIDIVSISTGYDHSLFLDRKGLIYAYGNNDYGQLGPNEKIVETPSIITGLDDIVHIVAGNKYSLVMTNNGEVFKFGLEDDKINYSPIKVSIPGLIKV